MTDDMNELIRDAARRRAPLDERLSRRPEPTTEERTTSFDGGVRGSAPLSDEPDMNDWIRSQRQAAVMRRAFPDAELQRDPRVGP